MLKKSTKRILPIIIVGIVVMIGVAAFGFWYHNNIASTEDCLVFPDSWKKQVGQEGFVFLKKDAETIGTKYLLEEAQKYGFDFEGREITVYFNREYLCWVVKAELQPKDENMNVFDDFPTVRIKLDGTVYIVY